MAIARPGVVGNRFRTPEEALQTLVLPTEPASAAILHDLLVRGITGKAAIDALRPIYTSRAEAVANQLDQIRQGEYAYAQNPQTFVNNLAAENRSDDYAGLTDEELNTRLSDLQFLSNIGSGSKLSGSTTTVGSFDPLQYNYTNAAIDSSGFQPDIQVIQDLVNARGEKAAKEQAINSYLDTELPAELTTQREAYLSGESQRAQQMFDQEIRPNIEEEANVRGLLTSGYLPEALAAKATDIQSSLDTQRANVENTDYSFLADAAYRNKVRQLLEGQTDYRSALLNERQSQLSDQSNRFTASQNDINTKFQNDLTKQNYDLQLKQQTAALKRQSEMSRSNRNTQLISSVAGAAGAIGGAYFGGVGGAIGGGAAGNATGNAVPKEKG